MSWTNSTASWRARMRPQIAPSSGISSGPPGTFWERRETARIAAGVPRLGLAPSTPLMVEFPRDHDYRSIVEVTARFTSYAVDLPEFALARLHGAWTRVVFGLARGEQDLVDVLLDRVRAHGGEARLTDRALRILHKRGRVAGILLDGDDAPTGVEYVVTDRPSRELLDLTSDFDLHGVCSERSRSCSPPSRDLLCPWWCARKPSPSRWRTRSFLLPVWPIESGLRDDTPLVHLQRSRAPCSVDGAVLLVAEAAFPEGSPLPVSRAREAVLSTVEGLLPFIERHYLVVDSPHDGRPLWDYRSGVRKEVDRAVLRVTGGTLDAEPMTGRWRVDPPGLYGVAAEPIRMPLGGAYAVGTERAAGARAGGSFSRPGAPRESSRGPTGSASACGARCGARSSSSRSRPGDLRDGPVRLRRRDDIVHDHHRDVGVNDDAERVDEACDERSRARRRVHAETLHDERQHRSYRASRDDDA